MKQDKLFELVMKAVCEDEAVEVWDMKRKELFPIVDVWRSYNGIHLVINPVIAKDTRRSIHVKNKKKVKKSSQLKHNSKTKTK